MLSALSPDRRWLLATIVLVAVLGTGIAVHLTNTAWTEPESSWGGDSGRHFYEGQRVGLALRNFELGLALAFLEARDLWPPLQVVVYGAIVAIFGPDYRYAVLTSVLGWVLGAAFAAGVAFNLWRACRRDPPDTAPDRIVGVATGVLAGVWFASTPLMLDSAFTTYQEAVAMMLLALALLFWIDMSRSREAGDSAAETRAAWRVASVTTVLALWRYATWMEWLVAWMIVEMVGASRQQWRALFAEARQRLRWRPTDGGPSFWHQPLLLLADLLALVWFINVAFHPLGERVVVMGREISVRTGGNLIYAVLLLSIAGVTWVWFRYRVWFRETLSRLPVVWRALLGAHMIPMTVWFVLPNRTRLFVNTLFFKPPHHKTVYDPLVLIERDLFAVPALAPVLAVLALVAAALWWRTTTTGRRYVLLCLLVSLPVLVVPYEARYALPALVPVVPLVAVTVARLLAELAPAWVGPGNARAVAQRWGGIAAIAVSAALVAIILISSRTVVADGVPRPSRRHPEIVAARAAVVEAAGSQTDSLLVLTDLTHLRPWEILAEFDEHYGRVLTGIASDHWNPWADPQGALDGVIDEHAPDTILVYRGGPHHTAFDEAGVAVVALMPGRRDYELSRTAPGGNPGDVIEVWIRSGDRVR
ncbi:MAG: hypothetical protein R3344_02215 [Acidobacteriota bacterium]|nr:hypothetical protein [Acidobacteriota bacterium]